MGLFFFFVLCVCVFFFFDVGWVIFFFGGCGMFSFSVCVLVFFIGFGFVSFLFSLSFVSGGWVICIVCVMLCVCGVFCVVLLCVC